MLLSSGLRDHQKGATNQELSKMQLVAVFSWQLWVGNLTSTAKLTFFFQWQREKSCSWENLKVINQEVICTSLISNNCNDIGMLQTDTCFGPTTSKCSWSFLQFLAAGFFLLRSNSDPPRPFATGPDGRQPSSTNDKLCPLYKQPFKKGGELASDNKNKLIRNKLHSSRED